MRNFSIVIIVGAALAIAGCGSSPQVNNGSTNGNPPKPNSNTASSPAANLPEGTTAKPAAATENAAPTLGPVVQAYYDGLRRKDEAAVRAVMSTGFIKYIEDGMREEKKKDLVAYLSEYDKIPEKPMEVRNEKITGDKGVAEVKGGSYINWFALVFVNEGGKWKLTNDSPDKDAVKSQDTTGK